MKRKILSLATVCLLVLSISVSAVGPRLLKPRPTLSFNGTTAYCEVYIASGSDKISATLQLWCGESLVASWSETDYGSLGISETCGVVKGNRYTLKVMGTVAGTPFTGTSVTGTC